MTVISLQEVCLRLTFYSCFVTTEIFPEVVLLPSCSFPPSLQRGVFIVPRCGALSVCDLIITCKLPVYLNTRPPLG